MSLNDSKTEKIKVGFSSRLQQMMIDKGFQSPKAPHKANTQKLADAGGISRQMAARYINGDALPETKILHNIANWLKCDPWWLLYGKKQEAQIIPQNKISHELLKFILSDMRELVAEKSSNADDFSFLFDSIINIYNNANEIGADLESQKKTASVMLEFIKHQYKTTKA